MAPVRFPTMIATSQVRRGRGARSAAPVFLESCRSFSHRFGVLVARGVSSCRDGYPHLSTAKQADNRRILFHLPNSDVSRFGAGAVRPCNQGQRADHLRARGRFGPRQRLLTKSAVKGAGPVGLRRGRLRLPAPDLRMDLIFAETENRHRRRAEKTP